MILSDVTAHHAARFGDKSAVISGRSRTTYATLQDRVARLANGLRGLGCRKGDRIGLLSTNRAEYIESVFAIAEAGLVWVPLNYRLAPAELEYIIGNAECAAVIFSADLTSTAEALQGTTPSVAHWLRVGDEHSLGLSCEDVIARSRPDSVQDRAEPDDMVAIMYTSGTTGLPKGAMITHRQMLSGMAYTAIASGAAASDISLQAIPQFHAGGNISQMAQILVGSTMVVPPRFDPELFLRLIEDEGVTSTCLVPSMLTFFLEHPRLNSRRVATMRRLMYGGSAIAPDRLSRALEIFSADFQQVYGQTEACVFATLMTGEDHRRALAETDTDRLLSCGRPMLGYEVLIAEATSPGAPGELLVRGDSVMTGYWRQPAATEKTLRNGWLHTGDLARLDSNGYVYIVDRTTDMIVSGGENVYPAEVENVISAHPGVLEVAVIGVPDDIWGESVKAVVALRPGKNFPADEIIAFCRGRIAGYKVPKSIDFADELPRTPSGKIKKTELRAKYWGENTRKIN